MSLFGDIYDLYFNVGTGELGNVIEARSTVPAPEDSYAKPVILKSSGPVENKVQLVHQALVDFQPMTLDSKGGLKVTTALYSDPNVGGVWKDLMDVKEGGSNGADARTKMLIQQMISYCKTRYAMMCSGGDRLTPVNGDLFRSVAKNVGEVKWVTTGTLWVTTDSRTRLQYMAINPLFVLRAIIETFQKQVYDNKISNDVPGLAIIGKQVVCYLFMHEFSHIAYGHLNGIESHKIIFGDEKANYSFDSFINRNIENDEGWVTPDSGISTAQYALVEAATVEGKFSIVLTAFLAEGDLFTKIDRMRQMPHIPNSLIGVVPICGESPDLPSMQWEVKKNMIIIMDEKHLFSLEEQKTLGDLLNKGRKAPPKAQPKPPQAQPNTPQKPSPPKPPQAQPKDKPNELTQEEREELAHNLHKVGQSDDNIKAITGLGILPVWVADGSQKTPQDNPLDASVEHEIAKVAKARSAASSTELTPAPAPVIAQPMIQPVAAKSVEVPTEPNVTAPAPEPAPVIEQPMIQPVTSEPTTTPTVVKARVPRKRPVTVEPVATAAAAPEVQPMIMPVMPDPVILPPAATAPIILPAVEQPEVVPMIQPVPQPVPPAPVILPVMPAPVIMPEPEPAAQPMIQPVMPAPVIMPEPVIDHPLSAEAPNVQLKHGGGTFKMYDRVQVSPSGQIGMIASDYMQQGMYKIVVGPKSGYIDPARLTLLPRLYAEGDVVTITASGIKGTVTKVKPGVHDTLYISVIKNGKHFMYYADSNQVTKS